MTKYEFAKFCVLRPDLKTFNLDFNKVYIYVLEEKKF